MDSNLLFSKHVERVALQIKQKLGILRRLRGTFNTRYLSMIYWGYILPHALYCCTVWTNRSHHNYEIINQLHKRAAYIISGCSWYTPSEQVLVQLNWSSLQELYSKALGCMAFKCVHQLAPSLLVDKFVLHDDVAQRTTRNSNQLKLKSNSCKTEFYKRSFVNSAISYWNELPAETRCSPNLNMFKSKLWSRLNKCISCWCVLLWVILSCYYPNHAPLMGQFQIIYHMHNIICTTLYKYFVSSLRNIQYISRIYLF